MCEVLILMLNSFYRVYYQLFDLCEHTLISVLILFVVLICFVPALFTMKTEEQRPLFTIGVLVCGVVGGLTVVISVVYLYRFCLKKRNPVSTTGNPDYKREHIRSVVVGLSRPLPLPPEFLTAFTPNKNASTTTLGFKDEAEPEKNRSIVPMIVSNDSNYALRLSQNTYNTLLSVSPSSTRAHSAELHPPEINDEVRRSSFEVQRGTGRQLPSTEGLEPQAHQFEHDRQRRMSNFARSNAVNYGAPPPPRKQFSSPLPNQSRRIYERGHAHSRSWNSGAAQPSSSSSPPPPPPHPIIDPNPYRFFEKKTNEEFNGSQRMMDIPIINEPPSPTPMESTLRRQSFVPRQAKSFDDRMNQVERRHQLDHRSFTLSEKTRDEREKNEVSAACQSLWAAKGHLEQLHALGISEPSSVSTSFESNTDSQATGDTIDLQQQQNAKGKRMQYKSLLLQRQFLSTAAVSSVESNNSTDESDPVFASSFDSTRSELERRRLSLMNQPDDSDETSTNNQRRNFRDYSVDATSDSLFREWSRVDPAYAPIDTHRLQRGHTIDHHSVQSQLSPRRFQRQYSLATSSSIAQDRRRSTMISYRNN